MNSALHPRRLRITGISLFVLGLLLASILYFGRKPDLPEDASTVGFYKSTSRQMGVMYGQFGVMVDDLAADLKRPGVQAVIVLVLAAIAAIVCFHLARLCEAEAEQLK